MKIKVFGKQVRLGSRYADIPSAERVVRAFQSAVIISNDDSTLLLNEDAMADLETLDCNIRKPSVGSGRGWGAGPIVCTWPVSSAPAPHD